jgi:tetratricopeptide (TPR) repeat protein
MARLHRAFPKDVEIAIYHALAQLATAPRTGTTFAQQRRAVAILEPLFARYPDHPGLAHYVIHATDTPQLAHLGLRAARRYAQIAPAAPHAQHMPSHIFVRLGLWDETVASNRRSVRAGVEYAKAAGLTGAPEELHALDYEVYGYLQRGEDSAARAAVAMGQRHATSNARGVVASYNGTAMAARIPLERGDWATAAAFPLVPDSLAPIASALARFTRAIGSARSGRVEQARAEVKALDAIATALDAKGEPYWTRVVRIKRDAADAWARLAAGDTARALALAKAAADSEEVTDKHQVTPGELLPARELEGDLLLAAGHPSEARAAYRRTLAREPGRARSTFGAARAAELAGDRAAAAAGYREFLRLMARANPGRPEIATAASFVAAQ